MTVQDLEALAELDERELALIRLQEQEQREQIESEE